MSRRAVRVRRLFVPRLVSLENRLTPVNHNWTGNGATASWSDPGNWTGGVPGPTDYASLVAGGVVVPPGTWNRPVVDAPAVVGEINFYAGGGLIVNSTLTVGTVNDNPIYGLAEIQIGPSGQLITNGIIDVTQATLTGSGTWTNNGTITVLGAAPISIGAGTQLINGPAGTIRSILGGVATSAGVNINALGTFTNQGLIVQPEVGQGTGGTITGTFLNSGGTLWAQKGQLSASASQHNSGVFKADAGAVLNLSSATASIAGDFTGSGPGTINFLGGTLNVTGPTTFNFADALLVSGGGTINGSVTIKAGSFISFDGDLGAACTIVNNGTVRQVSTGSFSGHLINNPGGLYRLEAGGGLSGGMLTNNGIVRSVAGPAGMALSNPGGNIDVQVGTLDLPGTTDLSTGSLTGHGAVADSIVNSAGTVRPGSSPGELTINGDYTQSGAGQFIVELAGTTAGTLHDQLIVNGGVALGGDLKVGLGFIPAKNDSFTVLVNDSIDAITGTFNNLAEGATFKVNNTTLSITYKGGTGNDVVLTVTDAGAVAPPRVSQVQVNGGGAQHSNVISLAVTFDNIVTLPALPATAFQLKRQSDNMPVALSANLSSNPNTVVTLTFVGGPVNFGSLADGRYTLTVDATKVTGPGGLHDGNGNGVGGDDYVLVGTPANGLYRLSGDVDGNGIINGTDFLVFRLAFLTNNATFDFDGNGQVDAGDFLQFRLRFLQSV